MKEGDFEGSVDIPFNIKRAYSIFGANEGVSRGFHAHKNLQQIAVFLRANHFRVIMFCWF